MLAYSRWRVVVVREAAVVTELAVLAVVALASEIATSAGRRALGFAVAEVVAALVIVVVREAAVPSSLRWWSRWPACSR